MRAFTGESKLNRNGLIVVVVVLVIFVVAGGVLIAKSIGGGGKQVTYDVTVSGNSMTPSAMSAKQGDTVTINMTGDKVEEVHLHVYDIMFQLGPGQTVSHTFKADKTCGPCDIEIEATSTGIGGLTVKP
jgi:plastocyanin